MAACRSLHHIAINKPSPLKKHEESNEESLCFGDDSSSTSSPLSSSTLSPSSFSSSPFSSLSSSSSFPIDFDPSKPNLQTGQHYRSDSLVSMSSESLSICTENLGLESCEDVEISMSNNNDLKVKQVVSRKNIIRHKSDELSYYTKHSFKYITDGEPNISRITGEEIPPPISSIGRNAKPWVRFKSFRDNGRFVLKKVRIPSEELYLHSCREDGRLKLQFIQSNYHQNVEE